MPGARVTVAVGDARLKDFRESNNPPWECDGSVRHHAVVWERDQYFTNTGAFIQIGDAGDLVKLDVP